MRKALFLFGIALLLLPHSACKKKSEDATYPAAEMRPPLTPAQKEKALERLGSMEEQTRIEEIIRKRDRARFVRPASPDFTPEAQGRKIRLSVALKKKRIRKGENLWYQLRVQNVGTESIRWDEYFFKDGDTGTGDIRKWKYYIKDPNGKELKIQTGPFYADVNNPFKGGYVVQFPPGMTDEEKEETLERRSWSSEAEASLNVQLKPGETIVTSSWRYVPVEEAVARQEKGLRQEVTVPGEFRELTTFFEFKTTGTYRFRVVFADKPISMPDTYDIEQGRKYGETKADLVREREEFNAERFGIVSSNAVEFEVVP